MFFFQRKAGFCVIEGDGVEPGGVAMAGLAGLSEIALVRLVGLMATKTCERCFGKALRRFVATGAGHIGMCSAEREIGLPVVEKRPVELNHIKVAALVIIMAQVAGRTFHEGIEAMKAAAGIGIGFYRLVAVKAQAVLCVFCKWRMAQLATFFDLGVACRHRSRHQQFLQWIGGFTSRRRRHQNG